MNTTDHPPPPPPPSSTTGTPANRAGPSYPPHGGSAVTPITHASSSSFQEEDQKIRSQNNREYSPWDGYMGGNRSESNDSQQYRDQEEKNTAYGYRKNPHYPSRGYEAPAPYPYSNDSFDHGAQYVQRRQESFPYPPSTGGPHYRHGFDEARAEVPYQCKFSCSDDCLLFMHIIFIYRLTSLFYGFHQTMHLNINTNTTTITIIITLTIIITISTIAMIMKTKVLTTVQ